MRAQLTNNEIIISFPYNPFTVDRIKTLQGRRYEPKKRYWIAPPTRNNIRALHRWGFEFDQTLLDLCNQAKRKAKQWIYDPRMRPFQRKGTEFISHAGGRVLIADDMGLGKSVQALAWLNNNPQALPAIIVCPASLKLNWGREIDKWTKGASYFICSGTKPDYIPKGFDYYIVNYDILGHSIKITCPQCMGKNNQCKKCKGTGTIKKAEELWAKPLRLSNPPTIIFDECHKLKNSKTNRTKAAKILCKNITNIIALSGTPILSRPIEFFTILNILSPQQFPSLWNFAHRYCGARHNGWGWDFSGATNIKELHKTLTNTIMIRRLKRDVLPELPKKIRTIVPLEINNRQEYDKAEKDFMGWLKNKDSSQAIKASKAMQLARIEGLKQITLKMKSEPALNWIEDFLEAGQKLVVFCTHHIAIDTIMARFKKQAVCLDGRTSDSKKQEAEDAFQNSNKIRLLAGNIEAAGEGRTLTAGDAVAFFELPWTPKDVIQPEDRVYGRINDPHGANIYFLIAAGTIEEDIAALLDKKAKVLGQVLDGKEPDQGSLLTELLQKIGG